MCVYIYIYIYIHNINRFSINIPVYLSAIFYVFKIRILPNMFWKIWVVIAVLDELRVVVKGYSGLVDLLFYTGPVIPLYVIGAIYAYFSPTIWKSVDATNVKI